LNNSSTNNVDLLRKHKAKIENRKHELIAPNNYKSKMFPSPEKSQLDNWMPESIYNKSKCHTENAKTLNGYLGSKQAWELGEQE